MHATILAYMFSLVEMNRITVPLRPDITAIQNMAYVQEFMANLLKAAFPHLNEWVSYSVCTLIWFNPLMHDFYFQGKTCLNSVADDL